MRFLYVMGGLSGVGGTEACPSLHLGPRHVGSFPQGASARLAPSDVGDAALVQVASCGSLTSDADCTTPTPSVTPSDTVTAIAADVVVLPAASRATAVTLWPPAVEVAMSQRTLYGAVVSSAPTALPSILNCTPATPTSSVALATRSTGSSSTAPAAGAVTSTVGGVVSAGGGCGGGGGGASGIAMHASSCAVAPLKSQTVTVPQTVVPTSDAWTT